MRRLSSSSHNYCDCDSRRDYNIEQRRSPSRMDSIVNVSRDASINIQSDRSKPGRAAIGDISVGCS